MGHPTEPTPPSIERPTAGSRAAPGGWLSALFEQSPAAIGFSRDGITLDANPAYLRLFGFADASELRGRPLLDQIAPAHRADIVHKIAQRAHGEFVPPTYETWGVRKDGSEFPFEITTDRVMLDEGPLTIAFITDISERHRATEQLTEALRLNRLILSASTLGCLVYDAEGPCVFANEAAGRIIGASVAQAAELDFRAIPSWRASGLYERALVALDTGVDQHGYAHMNTTFGQEIWVEFQLARAESAGRTVLLLMLRDTSAEHRARLALHASEERLQLALAAVNDTVLDWNLSSGETYASPNARALFGFPDEASIPPWPAWSRWILPEDRAAFDAMVREYAAGTREEHRIEVRVGAHPDAGRWVLTRGRVVEHDAQGLPRRVVGTLTDIDARKRAEAAQRALDERVRHTQKLEGLGVLAGGIAHDFNNILAVIQGSTAVAQRQSAAGVPVDETLQQISLATQRAADLCRQMLAYAGRARLVVEPFDLDALVGEMTVILDVSVTKKARLVRERCAHARRVVGDPTQVRQVVMNLVLNASEAIGDARGTIHVRTGAGRYDSATFARSVLGEDLPAGEYAWLEVEDDGCGMGPEVVARMFDPFFSTKFTGRGLGMAAVLGIVRGHAGAIAVDSAPGRGSRIRVYLPLREAVAEAPVASVEPEFRGEGLVLLVDDEPRLRFTTEKLLQMLGFEVVQASNGEEALEAYRAHRERVVVVMLDLTMPVMDGAEALQCLRQIDPNVRVILTSGYGAEHLEARLRDQKPDDVLEKPYVWDRLVEVLRKATTRR